MFEAINGNIWRIKLTQKLSSKYAAEYIRELLCAENKLEVELYVIQVCFWVQFMSSANILW